MINESNRGIILPRNRTKSEKKYQMSITTEIASTPLRETQAGEKYRNRNCCVWTSKFGHSMQASSSVYQFRRVNAQQFPCRPFWRTGNLLCRLVLPWCIMKLFFQWRCGPTRAIASSFLRFLDHIKWRITFGRIPLDEWSARSRDLYLTKYNTYNRQTSVLPAGFEPTISAGEGPHVYTTNEDTETVFTYMLSLSSQEHGERCTIRIFTICILLQMVLFDYQLEDTNCN
jgi:hypothetical protein